MLQRPIPTLVGEFRREFVKHVRGTARAVGVAATYGLATLLPDPKIERFNATVKGTLDAKQMKQVRTEMKTMRETMRKQLQNDEIETSSYLQAIEFYNSLETSVNGLERPDARKQLGGDYRPRARNVQELVDYMTDNGLKFWTAAGGHSSASQKICSPRANSRWILYPKSAATTARARATSRALLLRVMVLLGGGRPGASPHIQRRHIFSPAREPVNMASAASGLA